MDYSVWSAFCFSILILATSATERDISSFLNKDCDNKCPANVTLIYVKAVGNADTVHQVWDFSRKYPTIMYAVTKSPLDMKLNWDENYNLPIGFILPEQPTYSFAIAINRLWEFNDLKDTAIFDPKINKGAHSIDMNCFQWQHTDLIQSKHEVFVAMAAYGCKKRQGTFSIKLDLLPYTDYSINLPHLIHSSNSTQVDIVLDNITTTNGFNSSRFAIEMLFISEEDMDGSIAINTRKSLDDEHTPGIFEVVEILTPETVLNGDGGFIQYRPVVYIKPERDVETSRNVSIFGPLLGKIPKDSTAQYFFNTSNVHRLIQRAFITLGSKGDGFYVKDKYASWTFSMGYGAPPADAFSVVVILIMSIGLGVPFVGMLTTGSFVYYKKWKNRNPRQRLTESDQ